MSVCDLVIASSSMYIAFAIIVIYSFHNISLSRILFFSSTLYKSGKEGKQLAYKKSN